MSKSQSKAETDLAFFRECLKHSGGKVDYAAVAAALDITDSAVRSRLWRLMNPSGKAEKGDEPQAANNLSGESSSAKPLPVKKRTTKKRKNEDDDEGAEPALKRSRGTRPKKQIEKEEHSELLVEADSKVKAEIEI